MSSKHDDSGLRLAPVLDLHERNSDICNASVGSSDGLAVSGLCPDAVPRGLVTLRIIVLTWSISVCLLAMVRPPPRPHLGPSSAGMPLPWLRRVAAPELHDPHT